MLKTLELVDFLKPFGEILCKHYLTARSRLSYHLFFYTTLYILFSEIQNISTQEKNKAPIFDIVSYITSHNAYIYNLQIWCDLS